MRQAQEPPNWRELHAKARDKGIRKRTFVVVGTLPVAGKRKGETVELEMTADAIDCLILAGAIQETGATVPAISESLPEAITARLEDQAGPTAETRATRAQTRKKG